MTVINQFDSSIHAWNLRNGEEVQDLVSTKGEWNAAGIVSLDFSTLAVLDEDGLRFFDLQNGHDLGTLQLDHYFLAQQDLITYALSSDWKHLAISQRDGNVGLWDASTGDQLWVNGCASSTGYEVVFSPGDKLLAAIENENICVWDVNSGTRLFTLKGEPEDYVGRLAFSSDGSTLVSRSRYQVTIWNLTNGEGIGSLKEHGFGGAVAAISPDGKLVAAGYETGIVRVWDTDTKLLSWEKNPLKQESEVRAIQFSTDGLTLFVDYVSSGFMVMNTSNGEELFRWDVTWEALPFFYKVTRLISHMMDLSILKMAGK